MLTWVDHDSAARERSLRILALFQEKESRDELGFGGIRDAIADKLFPGTSTIQTRLRYMLFVPWAYQLLEARRTSSSEIAARGRNLELQLVSILLKADDRAGLFGVTAGKGLKRLPSSVYWAGLGSWGIRVFDGSQDDYHRAFDRILLKRQRTRSSIPSDEEAEPATSTWHPRLPQCPAGFPQDMSFALTQEEAEFLRDRIVSAHPESLLAHLVLHCRSAESDAPWEHPDLATFTLGHRELLRHARLFSQVTHGAAILYNLALAELAGRAPLFDELRDELSVWVESLDRSELNAWDLPRFWELVLDSSHSIAPATRRFVEQWADIVRGAPERLVNDKSVRQLVECRERLLKKSRSRFVNQRARDQWQGRAGMTLLTYRWPTVRSFHRDLQAGLEQD